MSEDGTRQESVWNTAEHEESFSGGVEFAGMHCALRAFRTRFYSPLWH